MGPCEPRAYCVHWGSVSRKLDVAIYQAPTTVHSFLPGIRASAFNVPIAIEGCFKNGFKSLR